MVYTRPLVSTEEDKAVKRIRRVALTLLLLLAWTGVGYAADPKADNKMGIITGGERGTYYQFGLDL